MLPYPNNFARIPKESAHPHTPNRRQPAGRLSLATLPWTLARARLALSPPRYSAPWCSAVSGDGVPQAPRSLHSGPTTSSLSSLALSRRGRTTAEVVHSLGNANAHSATPRASPTLSAWHPAGAQPQPHALRPSQLCRPSGYTSAFCAQLTVAGLSFRHPQELFSPSSR